MCNSFKPVDHKGCRTVIFTTLAAHQHHFWEFMSFLFFFLRLYFFRSVWGSQQNWEDGPETSHRPPAPTHAQPPPSSTSPIRVGHLLQWMNLHRHTTAQSPELALGLTLGAVHSVTSDMCRMTCTTHTASHSVVPLPRTSSALRLFFPPAPYLWDFIPTDH